MPRHPVLKAALSKDHPKGRGMVLGEEGFNFPGLLEEENWEEVLKADPEYQKLPPEDQKTVLGTFRSREIRRALRRLP